jgi:hypothetical protein
MRSTVTLIFGLLFLANPPSLSRPTSCCADWRIVQAVAIKDGGFVAVGSNEEIAGRIGYRGGM